MTKIKSRKKKSKRDTTQIHIKLQRLADVFGNRVFDNPKSYGLNPIRVTPAVREKARNESDRLTLRMKHMVAKTLGKYNGDRLYFDKQGNVTTINPDIIKQIIIKPKLDLSKRKKLRDRRANPKTGRGVTILGIPSTSVIRWMGKHNWKKEEVMRVVEKLANGPVASLTIPTAMNHGKRGYRSIPKITLVQVKQLRDARKKT